MKDIINKFSKKIKSFDSGGFFDDLFIILIIFLVGLGSFAFGRLSLSFSEKTPIEINYNDEQEGKWQELRKQQEENKKFVASKNGSKYYPVNCSATSRINEENKIFFTTEQEALDFGLSRTSSCK